VYAVDVKAPPGASLEAAAATAAYGVLSKLYWSQTPAFDVALEASLAAMPDGQPKTDGMAVGKEVVEKFMAQRSKDGSNANVAYTPGTGPGVYQVLLQEWLVICYNGRDCLDPRSPETSHERFFPIQMAPL
jgi:hypothetical protein